MPAPSSPCPECGAPVFSGGPLGGLCPECLLAAGKGGDELETLPATGSAGSEEQTLAAEPRESHEPAPESIGPYRLLGLLGEGGMGRVYAAEQKKPIRRKVALKVVKPGMDSREILARFEAERQALALMDHPGIARVYEAGATPEGRPYFVMEYVEGLALTDYCDRKKLSLRDRLQLFAGVCDAVQHAHQKGIIHRDLKPSNLLVCEVDDKPVVKVIDFGVAKALEFRLTDRTLFTEFGQLMGTPEYMSPEQASLECQGVDTRTDVYALGVILYELLAGVPPLGSQLIRQAGLLKMLEIIQEFEPLPPSSKFATLEEGVATSVSDHRDIGIQRLKNTLRGDLDWIVMRAIDKVPSLRYQTVAALGEDVARFLRSEPVSAGPPSRLYRMRKFARRNRGVVTSSAAVMMALLVGLATSLWQAKVADARRLQAERATSRLLEESGRRWLLKARDATVESVSETGERFVVPVFPDMPLMAAKAFGFSGYGRPAIDVIQAAGPEVRRFWEESHPSFLTKKSNPMEFRAAEETAAGLLEGVGFRYGAEGDDASRVHSPGFELLWSGHPLFDPTRIRSAALGKSARILYTLAEWDSRFDQDGLFGWDAGSGAQVGYLKGGRPISFDVDPDRSRVAVLTRSQWTVWSEENWPEGKPVARGPHKADLIAFRPGSDQVAFFGGEGIEFVELSTGQIGLHVRANLVNPWKARFDKSGSRMIVLDESGVSAWTEDSGNWTKLQSLLVPVIDAALAPDGARLAVLVNAGRNTVSRDIELRVFEITDSGFTQLGSRELPDCQTCATSFTSDARELMIALCDLNARTTRLESCNPDTGDRVRVISENHIEDAARFPTALSVSASSAVMSFETRLEDGARTEAAVELIDLKSGRPILAPSVVAKPTQAVFDRDGLRFALLSRNRLSVLDSETAAEIWSASPRKGFYFSSVELLRFGEVVVAESPCGNMSEDVEGRLRYFASASGEETRGRETVGTTMRTLHSRDGRRCVLVRTFGAYLWTPPAHEREMLFSAGFLETSTTIQEVDDSFFMLFPEDGRTTLHYEPENPVLSQWGEVESLDFGAICSAVCAGTSRIAFGGEMIQKRGQPNTGKIEIRSQTGILEWSQELPEPVTAIAFSPDGSTFLAGTEKGDVWVYNRIYRFVLKAHDSPIRALSMGPTGRRLLTLSEDGSYRMWRTKPEALIRSIEVRSDHLPRKWCFTESSDWLRLVGSSDEGIHLPSRCRRPLPEELRWSDVEAPGSNVATRAGRRRDFSLAKFATEGRTLEAFVKDGLLIVCDGDGPDSMIAEKPLVDLPGLADGVGDVDRVSRIKDFDLSPDGRRCCVLTLAGASIWDLETGQVSQPAIQPILADFCDFSNDGKLLALSGTITTARQSSRFGISIWDVDSLVQWRPNLSIELARGLIEADDSTTTVKWNQRPSLVAHPPVLLRPTRIVSHDSMKSNSVKGARDSRDILLNQLLDAGALQGAWDFWKGMNEPDQRDAYQAVLEVFRSEVRSGREVSVHYEDGFRIQKPNDWLRDRVTELENLSWSTDAEN